MRRFCCANIRNDDTGAFVHHHHELDGVGCLKQVAIVCNGYEPQLFGMDCGRGFWIRVCNRHDTRRHFIDEPVVCLFFKERHAIRSATD